jgi:hypothetical protein
VRPSEAGLRPPSPKSGGVRASGPAGSRLFSGILAVLLVALALGAIVPDRPAAAATAPANDSIASAQLLTGSSGSVCGTTVGATAESDENSGGELKPSSVWFEWQAPSTGAVRFTTEGSDVDTAIRISGTRTVSPPGITGNDDRLPEHSPAGRASAASVGVVAGARYWVRVGTQDFAQGPFTLAWSYVGAPANDQLAGATPISGPSGSAETSTEGATPSHLEPVLEGPSVWFRWTAPSTGATVFRTVGSSKPADLAIYDGPGLGSLRPVATTTMPRGVNPHREVSFPATAGTTYWIETATGWAAELAGTVRLSWNVPLVAPANDPVTAPQVLAAASSSSSSGSVTGSNVGATIEAGEPDPSAGQGGASVWYTWTAPSSGSVSFTAAAVGPGIDPLVRVSTGAPGSLVPVQPDEEHLHPATRRVTFPAVAGTRYLLSVDGWSGSAGPFSLGWTMGRPPADDFASALVLADAVGARFFSAGDARGTLHRATDEPGEPTHAGNPAGRSIWLRWTAPMTGPVRFETTANTSTRVAAYTGTSVGALTPVASTATTQGNQTLEFAATAGVTYSLAVEGWQGAGGQLDTIRWSADTMAPVGTVRLAGGATSTTSPRIELEVPASDGQSRVTTVFVSNTGTTDPEGRLVDAAYLPYSPTVGWSIWHRAFGGTEADGPRTVWVQWLDEGGNASAVRSVSFTASTAGSPACRGGGSPSSTTTSPSTTTGPTTTTSSSTTTGPTTTTTSTTTTTPSTTTTTTGPTTTSSTTTTPSTTTTTTRPTTTTTSTTTTTPSTTTTTTRPTTTTSTTTTTPSPATTTTTARPATTTSSTTTTTTTRPTTTTAPPATTTTSRPATTTTAAPAPPAGPGRSGYWMLAANGDTYAFGDAPHLGNAPGAAVDLEPTPTRNGYWIVDRTGRVSAFGDAPHLGDAGPLAAGESVTSLSATADGAGYWIFTDRGRVVPRGSAPFHGDMSGTRLNGPILDSIPTSTGGGYYLVGSDGGIFTFGDAVFLGSMGDTPLNAPVQSLVPDPDGTGYWLVASDGGIFTFGADFHGSMGGVRLNRPVTGMVGSAGGYLMVAEDGGIFTFGAADFHGSLGDSPPPVPVVSVAAI